MASDPPYYDDEGIKPGESITIGFTVATTSWLPDPPQRDTDKCKCGHTRKAHIKDRCQMETWPKHRCSCTLFRQ